jgi:hypothetical protein
MPKDSEPTDSLSWFYNLPMDDQVALLNDPYQPLSQHLIDRLDQQQVTGTHWVQSRDPVHWSLTAPAAVRLEAIRAQLDDWWDGLAHHEHLYVIQQRAGELDATYDRTVQAADGPAFGVALVRDLRNANQFRLPAMIRAYVEMKAR